MLASKIVKCKVFYPTALKYNLLNEEYQNLQEFLKLKDIFWWDKSLFKDLLYSANKQQGERYYKRIKDKEYPLIIRKDLIKVEKTANKLTEYWVKIPIKKRRGGLWLPIKPHCNFPNGYTICRSIIIKKKNDFFVHITIQKEIKIKKSYSNILAIDLGEKVIATTCGSFNNQRPIFYGREVRGIRRHYNWLRKRLGEKKLLKVIKRIGDKERRAINQKLHEISKEIVSFACQHDSLILLGDLKGIRKHAKGRRFNRIVSNMPYFKLTTYITYKAAWQGIKVIKVNEKGTSKTCSKCGHESKLNRKTQGFFCCKKCGYQVNADYNGAKNILKRFLEQVSKDGASLTMPITLKSEIK